MKNRYYAVGSYYQATVMDADRQVPIASVTMAVPGAKTQSALDGAAFIAELMNAYALFGGRTLEAMFKAGWAAGYADGGEHDCRMFTPTADRAWDDWKQSER